MKNVPQNVVFLQYRNYHEIRGMIFKDSVKITFFTRANANYRYSYYAATIAGLEHKISAGYE
jgi:hypothetical protein